MNPYLVNTLGGRRPGQELGDLFDQIDKRKKQEQMQSLMQQASTGDTQAITELYGLNPQAAELFENRLMQQNEMQQQQKEKEEKARQEATIEFIAKMSRLPPEQQQEAFNMAVNDDKYDIDEDDREYFSDPNVQRALLTYHRSKEFTDDLFGGTGIDPVKQQELDIKREANEIRRLENKERSLDRQLSRETNELKRQELEDKIAQNKTQREQKSRDIESQANNAVATFDNSLETIDKILNSKGFESAVGARIPFIDSLPGSDAQETIGLIETLESQNFLNQIEKMKGLGALSNAEGQKVSSAIGSLNRNMSEEAFKRSLNQIKQFLEKGRRNVIKKYGMPQTEKPTDEQLLEKYG